MIDLYYWTTPNGHKITIMLEECGLPYKIVPVNIGTGEQFEADFLAVSPNNRMPAIVDHEPAGGGAPISVLEFGAILLYLAEKTGKFLPKDLRGRNETVQWVNWQMGGLGPMAGQANHFNVYAPENGPQLDGSLRNEVNRLFGVSTSGSPTGSSSPATSPSPTWRAIPGSSLEAAGPGHRRLPARQTLAGRDLRARSGQRAYAKAKEVNPDRPGRRPHRRAARHPVRPDRSFGGANGGEAVTS